MTRTLLNRRQALKASGAAGVGAGVAVGAVTSPQVVEAGEGDSTPLRIVDTNVHLGRWPFRRLPLDHPQKLRDKLQRLGVAKAWVGSFDAILHRDLAAVNQRVAEACRNETLWTPVGAVHPGLVGWRDDLARCVEYGMRVVRLYPGYHGYSLSDEAFHAFLKLADARRLLVQLAVTLEDPRTQHERFRVADVDLRPLPELLQRIPTATVQLLNLRPSAKLPPALANHPRIYFDTSRVDSTDGVPNLVEQVGVNRVLFGSHAPLLIPEASLIRVHESNRLSDEQLRAVYGGSADRLLKRGLTRVPANEPPSPEAPR